MTKQKRVLKARLTELMHNGYCYAAQRKVAFIGNEFEWHRIMAERSHPKKPRSSKRR